MMVFQEREMFDGVFTERFGLTAVGHKIDTHFGIDPIRLLIGEYITRPVKHWPQMDNLFACTECGWYGIPTTIDGTKTEGRFDPLIGPVYRVVNSTTSLVCPHCKRESLIVVVGTSEIGV
jgi:hypothetical protein